jgi:hypothetical protein
MVVLHNNANRDFMHLIWKMYYYELVTGMEKDIHVSHKGQGAANTWFLKGIQGILDKTSFQILVNQKLWWSSGMSGKVSGYDFERGPSNEYHIQIWSHLPKMTDYANQLTILLKELKQ